MISNIRATSNKIMEAGGEHEDVFKLLSNIHAPNGNIVIDALRGENITSYEQVEEMKSTAKIGVMMHNVALDYVKEILKKSCIYSGEYCDYLKDPVRDKKCVGIHKCKLFTQRLRVSYETIRNR